ncbi:MAG: antibiotic biosynthesis monooxygenase [Polyangia bacterium]|jgi:quinol monooxygenase YgiN
MPSSYLVVLVHARVVPQATEAFRAASLANAAASLGEPGVVRFDILQDSADATHFLLIEVYRDGEGAAAHKQTEHYRVWRDEVAGMMAEPRSSQAYATVTPISTWVRDGRDRV